MKILAAEIINGPHDGLFVEITPRSAVDERGCWFFMSTEVTNKGITVASYELGQDKNFYFEGYRTIPFKGRGIE
jgi:hypothetical protein